MHSVEGLWLASARSIKSKRQIVVLLQIFQLLLANKDSLLRYLIVGESIAGGGVVVWVQMHHQLLPFWSIKDCRDKTTHTNEAHNDVISLLLEKLTIFFLLLPTGITK